MPDYAPPEHVRLDVWLDVACVCKTRSAARQACLGGKISVNGARAKPNREIRAGDRIELTAPHAPRRELGVKEVIVPLYPGLFSAWGMLATEPRRDFMQTVLRRAEEVEAGDVRAVFAGLREEAERYYQTDAHMGEAEIAYEGR
ncbi:MAG: hypothetical protein F4057_02485, partial [Acidobacteria bacterium]|nr:hypothetical protein [Acidobacteriota bacterium]